MLQGKLSGTDSRIESLGTQREERNNRLTETQNELNSINVESASLEGEIQVLGEQIEQFAADLEKILENEENLLTEIKDYKSELNTQKKYQGQLLQVKTNKEYSALLLEIKGLKSKNSLTEDDILELMESVERAKNALANSQEDLAETKIRIHQEKQEKEAEQVEIQKLLEKERKTRATLAKNVEESILKEYTKLLNLRNGVAVISVEEGGICAGCHVALTPQMFAEVKAGKYLHRCPTCFRFLYWTNSTPQNEEE